jgi:hypothetical protein
MTKLKLLSLVAVILLCGCSTLIGPRSVELPLAQLQERLAQRLPINKRYLDLFDVRLDHPRLNVQGGRLAVTLDAAIQPLKSQNGWAGSFALSGLPRLDQTRQSLVLSQVRVDNLTINGLPSVLTNQLGRLGGALAEQFIADMPLYTFGPAEYSVLGTRMQATNINTAPNGLVITFEPVR